ncbi:MAG: sensor histidine kinase, partial [Limisphaerales bacterium]
MSPSPATHSPLNPGAQARCQRLSTVLASTALVIGAIGAAGWILGIDTFKRCHSTFVSMKFNTAVSLILAAAGLLLQRCESVQGWQRRIAQLMASISVAIGAVTLLEHVLGWDPGIDQFFFHESAAEAGRSFPGRTGVVSCLGLILLGIALLFLDERLFGRYISGVLALTTAICVLLVSLNYFYGVEQFETIAKYATIAPHTVVAFVCLSIAIMLSRPRHGTVATLCGVDFGSAVARRMLLPAILLPIVFGWLCILGHRAGLYGAGFGMAVFVLSLVVIFTGLIGWTAAWLNRAHESLLASERALRLSEEKFAVLFHKAPFAVGLQRFGDSIFVDVNEAFLRMFGLPKEKVVGKTDIDINMIPDPQERANVLMELQAGGGVLRQREIRMGARDGRDYVVLINADIVQIAGEMYLLATSEDITKRKRAEEALQKAKAQLQEHATNLEQTVAERTAELKETNEQLEAFVYSIAHDLRAPLRAMQGYSQILLEELAGKLPETEQKFLNKIHRSAAYMDRMILDLLAFGRTARTAIELHSVDVQKIWDAVCFQCAGEIEQTRAQIETVKPLPTVRAHEATLTQVLANLLSNA